MFGVRGGMRTKYTSTLVVGALLLSTPVHGQETVFLLAPATPWALDYAKDSCRLVRTFGTGDQEVTVGLTSFAPGGRFQLSAVGNLTRTVSSANTITIALDEVERMKVAFLQVDFGGRPGLYITNPISIGRPPPAAIEQMRHSLPVASYSDPAVEAQVKTIGFIDGLQQEFEIKTGSMQAPMKALKDCTTELVSHWDIDHAAHQSLTRGAVPKLGSKPWVLRSAYPREMRQPTMINARLIVDTEGRVADCVIIDAEEGSEFARLTCEMLRKNGSFSPALDANGQPVRSYYVTWSDFSW